MEYRYLIYRTDFDNTIVRESPTSGTTGVNEAELYTDFIIPEIQPLYFWRVEGGITVEPNTETNIDDYEESIALPHQPKDLITYGETTGLTDTKIDKISGGVVGNIPTIASDGSLADTGLNAADIIVSGSGLTRTEFNEFTGVTLPNIYLKKDDFAVYSGDTEALIENKLDVNVFEEYTGVTETLIEGKLDVDVFEEYTGVTETLIGTKLDADEFEEYTGATKTLIEGKLDVDVFENYTASTTNINEKIQVISTSTANANTVTSTLIPWNSAPVSGDTYLWTGDTAVWIKSAGTYEVQYQIVLRNDSANQTHSVGSYLIKNNTITVPLTASAVMIVGSNAGGGISLSPTVLTLENNDRLDLAVFRIGNPGNARLVSGVVHLMLNRIS